MSPTQVGKQQQERLEVKSIFFYRKSLFLFSIKINTFYDTLRVLVVFLLIFLIIKKMQGKTFIRMVKH